jgi:hypothetical protein
MPPSKVLVLTEEDATLLRNVLQEFRNRDRGLQDSLPSHPYSMEEVPGYPSDDIFTPEVYVAEIPEDGIPPLTKSGDKYQPGKAKCTIWRMNMGIDPDEDSEHEMKELHFHHWVFNLSTAWIERDGEDIFTIVWRDKFGRWFTKPGAESVTLIELCSLESADRNTPYACIRGVWDPYSKRWSYPDQDDVVTAIDHRMGSPYAEPGWKGLYMKMPSRDEETGTGTGGGTGTGTESEGVIYVCVSLDCAEPPEGCDGED